MSNEVYANNMEVSCKAAAGKSICAFPDVCFTPPTTPATPPGVPLPYPNTGMASDATEGSKSVQISGQEVMLKNKSYFKRSSGDEAGCAPKKGLINSKNMGKVYFKAWSMDVKCEGENVVRHFDLTTHNHASEIGNDSIPWLHVDNMGIGVSEECKDEQKNFKEKCGPLIQTRSPGDINKQGTSDAMCADKDCKKARECALLPYEIPCCEEKVKKGGKEETKRKTPHHLVPNSLLQGKRNDSTTNVEGLSSGYTTGSAPCCCAMGNSQYEADHGAIHEKTKDALAKQMNTPGGEIDYAFVRDSACKAHTDSIKGEDGQPACNAKCLAEQLDIHFKSRSENNDPSKIKLHRKDGTSRKKYPLISIGDQD